MNNNSRQRAESFGRKGEFWAALFLRLRGYSLIEKRMKSRFGEIDLILGRKAQLIFVEVKARRTKAALGEAFERVKRDRIVKAAKFWLGQNPKYQSHSIRFDVIGLAPWCWPVHIVDAFQEN